MPVAPAEWPADQAEWPAARCKGDQRVAPTKDQNLVLITSEPIRGLKPRVSQDQQSIELLDHNQVKVLEYGHLLVKDAQDKVLPSELRIEDERIIIAYGDKTAVYPVYIDQLMTTPAWTAESNQESAYFGISVAGAGDVNGDGYGDVIVGAQGFDHGQTEEGRAYLYLGSATGLSASSSWTAESDQASACFGYSVGSAGDINGDGYGDVIVGAHGFDHGQTEEGRAYLYLGSASGLSVSAAWTAESNQASAYFGISVAGAGDVNGDGYGDVICGAYRYDSGQTNEGRAYMYLGSASGLSASEKWTAESNQESANFGYSVASAGDVNGDGYGDVIVGAYLYDSGQANEGRAYVFLGTDIGLAIDPAWTITGGQSGAHFGVSVAGAGDVNGDGYGDVICGAYLHDDSQTDEGRAYLYLGSATGLAVNPAWIAAGGQASACFGISVARAGDVNGDGYGDVIVGAYLHDNDQIDEGRAYVYSGSATGLSASPAWIAESDQANAYFGISVAGAGDVNGDGYGDVICGAHKYDNGHTDEGRVYVYLGSAMGMSAIPAWTAESNQADAEFGISVAGAGDVNGDGYGDVICSARLFDNGQTDEGRVYVYLGNDAGGLSVRPRQAKADGSSLIGPGGAASDSPSNTQARIKLWARSSQGRTRARLQVETALPGAGFTGENLQSMPAYENIGIVGTDMELLLTGLQPMTAYRWRARLLYDPANAPNGLLRSPWYGMSRGGAYDFRTGPYAAPTPTPQPTPAPTPGPDKQIRAYPSRINPEKGECAHIRWYQAESCNTTIKLYNLRGELIKILADNVYYQKGQLHEIIWRGLNSSGSTVASGIYIAHIRAGDYEDRIKVGVIK